MSVASERNDEGVRVWDPLVRIGHWVLVAGFATAYLTEGESEWLHAWAGYAIAITVAIRIVWGLVGPRHARFSDFVTGPARVIGYLRDLVAGRARRHLGHSPAGGAMTIALLLALGATAVSGMATLAAEEGRGPLAGLVTPQAGEGRGTSETWSVFPSGDEDADYEEREGEESVWAEIHEVAANLTLVLIVLHIGGVVLASIVHRENLPRSMVTGLKRP